MLRTLLLVPLLLGAALLGGCMGDPGIWPDGPVHGVTLHGDDLTTRGDALLDEAHALGSVVAWAGRLDDLGAAFPVAARNADAGRHTAILTSPWNLTGNEHSEPSREQVFRDRAQLVKLVSNERIAFVGLGYEVDRAHDADPDAFSNFTTWWAETYDAIKDASPKTQVFPVFQYERMTGLQGGIYGGQNTEQGMWQLLDLFPKRDLTAFTTHPGMVYRELDHVPDDHYDAIEARDLGSVAFAAIGWRSAFHGTVWRSDEATQADFIDWFHTMAPPHDLGLWARLQDDPEARSPYRTMGLLDADGNAKPARERWRAVHGTD